MVTVYLYLTGKAFYFAIYIGIDFAITISQWYRGANSEIYQTSKLLRECVATHSLKSFD